MATVPSDYSASYLQDPLGAIDKLRAELSDLNGTLNDLRHKEPNCPLKNPDVQILAQKLPEKLSYNNSHSFKIPLKQRVVQMRTFRQPFSRRRSVAAVYQNGMAVVWDSRTAMKYEAFNVGKGSIMSLGINQSGSVLASGGLSCFVEVYSVGANLNHALRPHDSHDSLPLTAVESTALPNTGRPSQYRYALGGHDAAISAIEFLDDTHCVSGGLDTKIFAWDLIKGESVAGLYDTAPVTSVASDSTNGSNLFVTGSAGGHVKVWDIREKQRKSQSLQCHQSVNCVKFIGSNLVLASFNMGMQLFDLRTYQTLQMYRNRASTITCFDVTPSGRLAFVGFESGYIMPIDLVRNYWYPYADTRRDRISGVSIIGNELYFSSWDGTLKSIVPR